MALLKPRPLTPARREANRRNAQQARGTLTPRGKAQSRLNRLQHGGRSSLYGAFIEALLCAPPGCLDSTARHPLFAEMAEVCRNLSTRGEAAPKMKKIYERTQ